MRKQASPDSIGCHLPAAVSTSCHKHPIGADHLSPGHCLRLDPFYSSSQASAAGRSSSTMHCSQRGHLTPDTPSANREVTRAPSNQPNLPPKTTSPLICESEPPPLPVSTRPHHPTCEVQSLPQACVSATCLPARALQRHPCSAKAAWQEAGQESAGDCYSGSGGAGTSAQSSRLCVTALVLQHHCAPSCGCHGC